MLTRFLKKFKTYRNIIYIRKFFIKLKIKLKWLIIPAILAICASFLEGVSFGLLIPTIKGILEGSFDFIKNFRILKIFIIPLLDLLGERQSVVFGILVGFIFITAVLKNVFVYFSRLITIFIVRLFSNNLRKSIYNRYLSFGKLFFDRENSGNLYQILVVYSQAITKELFNVNECVTKVFMLIVYLIIMYSISWELTFFILICLPILYFLTRPLIIKIKKGSMYFAEAYSAMACKISNALQCIPLIKAYSHEEQEQKWFNYTSDRVQDIEFKMDKKRQLVNPLQEIILLFIILILVSLMAFFYIKKDKGEIAGYLVFFLILKRATNSFQIFSSIRASLASIRGFLLKVLDIFNDKKKYFIHDGSKELKEFKKNIKIEGAGFTYPGGVEVLKNINLIIEKGQTVAIVGETGGGKTTLINLLPRFYDVSVGKIKIDDIDLKELTLASLRSKIVLISQDPFLFNASLRFNITYGLDHRISEKNLISITKKAQLYNFIMRLPKGFDTEIGERGVKLSGGEKQRVAIARAMLKESEIIILDEATSSLDSITEKLIQKALDKLIQNKTSIIIAHRFSTINHADKIVVIESGRIIEKGTREELFKKKGCFYRYWQQQKFY
ncbi:MAG: ABC transporter ATP-binding protein/permease [Candidatus Omnitrophica bacterium]|nr:ABC transporter ATP-binding protein/permease [Candidatus Omnitrophota bacterium]